MTRTRRLLILLIGTGLLLVVTFLGSSIESLLPHRPTATVQTAQTDAYKIILDVMPNPPHIDEAALLTLRVTTQTAQPLPANAVVRLESEMQTMNMGTEQVEAQRQSDGSYQARVHLSMSGSWSVRVLVQVPGQQVQSTTFAITAQ